MDDSNVTLFPTDKKKSKSNDRMLTKSHSFITGGGCYKHSYLIDPESDKVTCKHCDKTFNPMAVLSELAQRESQWHMTLERVKEESKALDEKKKFKCQHCGKFTKVKAGKPTQETVKLTDKDQLALSIGKHVQKGYIAFDGKLYNPDFYKVVPCQKEEGENQ